MNAQETLEAAKLMYNYAEEWRRTGKEPTWLQVGAPVIDSEYMFCATPQWNWQHCHYRRRPEPATVPLGLEDMVPGVQLRPKGSPGFLCPYMFTAAGVEFKSDGSRYESWEALAASYEYRTPADPTWRPCTKPVST